MELRHFRYFVTLAQTLHFGRAAQALGIAAPTLTVQIQDIERALGVQLFVRGRRDVRLTAAGEMFLVEAQQVLAQAERAVLAGQRAGRGETGRVEIGYIGSAVYSGTLQTQLATFRQAWPGVIVTAREVPQGELPAMLAENRIDIALVRMPMNLHNRHRAHVLFRDSFCIALPAEHPLATQTGAVDADALERERFINPEQTLGTYETARRGGFTPAIGSAPGSLVAVLTQVALGEGVAIVPDVLVGATAIPSVVFKPLAGPPIHSEIAAVFRSFEPSLAVSKLIAQITRTAAVTSYALFDQGA
ncbi:LysR family transcriptional regulator [Pandoraea horticolens]|uniref:LysR family transcriptional regulator n=1 Tax=Pandoraea horticolens TaxID=2508298 RepID=A0A5E4UUC8_9BURK|nr:LysR substrate-binding domain-containing protein [Pandoraea horticolens]VVE03582.1 LysR family transcriptional regulator [Pandoraea horticolens]